ncbi:MAG: hypothetical protein ACQEP1_00835 [Nanobdellota archaeon]
MRPVILFVVLILVSSALAAGYDVEFAGDSVMADDSDGVRSVIGERITGRGQAGNTEVDIGYIWMLNTIPDVNSVSVPDDKVYTNHTLPCSFSVEEHDTGEKLTITALWFRNASDWYTGSETIDGNITDYVDKYDIKFEPYFVEETINHTMINETEYSSATSPFYTHRKHDSRSGIGSLRPQDTSHYDIWACSIDVFDQVAHSSYDYSRPEGEWAYPFSFDWNHSSPLFIYNHKTVFNESAQTYYEWPEDNTYQLDLGSLFYDIDDDQIDFSLESLDGIVDISISGSTAHITPESDMNGVSEAEFSAKDNLRNDEGNSFSSTIVLNVTPVNDLPRASDVYISPSVPSDDDTLECRADYNDVENHEKQDSSYEWWLQDESEGNWDKLDIETKNLGSNNFDLDDKVICSARFKDSEWGDYYNSSAVKITVDSEKPEGEDDNLIIGVG